MKLAQIKWYPDRVFKNAVKCFNRVSGNDKLFSPIFGLNCAKPKLEINGVNLSEFSISLGKLFDREKLLENIWYSL